MNISYKSSKLLHDKELYLDFKRLIKTASQLSCLKLHWNKHTVSGFRVEWVYAQRRKCNNSSSNHSRIRWAGIVQQRNVIEHPIWHVEQKLDHVISDDYVFTVHWETVQQSNFFFRSEPKMGYVFTIIIFGTPFHDLRGTTIFKYE